MKINPNAIRSFQSTSKRLQSTVSITTHIKIIQTKKVASNATSTAATNVQPHVQIVKSKSRPLLSIPQEKQCGSEQEREADTQKLEEIATDDNEDIYSFDRLVGQLAGLKYTQAFAY